MLTYVLTYHQVMPAFLDFLFPFGRQEHARGFPFSGFRHETRLNPLHNGLNIPALDRSGQELRMSYSLKSVEKSDGQIHWPWSIRQTAVYHSLDIKTGVSSWVVVKGNQLMKSRMELVTQSRNFRNANGFDSPARSFASSLILQLVICDWCSEDWRWYISFLEEALQEKTRRTLSIQVERVTSPVEVKADPMWTSSSTMPNSEKTAHSHLSLLDASEKPLPPPELPPGYPPPPPGRPQGPVPSLSPQMLMDPGNFTFSDMQRVQFLEDKANEVLSILESNMHVLAELEMHYTTVRTSECWPEEFIQEGSAEIMRFHNRIASVINDLRMQASRTKTLLRLLADRKSLVSIPATLTLLTDKYSSMAL
jgi:hypothetical protein